ncbi:hypothetical protein HJD18_03670 [Thermoleophilia bacterium SCSIO 60948]|nr:hypothetical protein HJD18_03670 [Thermoleophilia bacterium SCSIO 60948]
MGDHTPDANHAASHDPVEVDATKVAEVSPVIAGGQAWAPREVLADGRRVLLTRRDEDPAAEAE